MLETAGFAAVTEQDITVEFRATAAKWLEEAAALEPELRRAMGDEVFEEKQANRRTTFQAIEAGDLGRLRLVAEAH